MKNHLPKHSALSKQLICILLVTTVLMMMLPQALLSQATEGPALWLKFNETAGATSFADSGSGGINGTCGGNACPTAGNAGRLEQAAQFDGVDDRVQVNMNTPVGPYTLAAWVRFTGAAWDSWRTVLEFGDDSPWFGATNTGQLTLYSVITGGSIPVGQWTHIAYSWSGTESRLYVNGQAVAVNTTAPPANGTGLALALETNGPNPWLGLLDDVRVYTRSLNADELGQLAKPEAGPIVNPTPVNPTPNDARLFDLTVSIYKPVTTANERQPYEELFKLFADGIYEVSNGAHKIRTITVYDNGRFADRADIQWIQFEQQPRATTNGYGKGRGTVHMGDAIFSNNTLITDPNALGTFVNTLTHEWSHYTYGVLDEYEGSNTSQDPSSPQVGDTPPEPCSVMCAAPPSIEFSRLNFSTAKSTAGVNRTNTAQYRTFNASDWETVARTPSNDPPSTRGDRLYWADLAPKAPAAGQDPSVELPAQRTAARDALNIVWADANATAAKHRIFLVDVSADMAQDNKLESAKLSLKSYIDRTNVGDLIGIFTFADTHTVVQPLTRIESDATRTTIKAQIDAIQAKVGITDRKIDAADQAAIVALQQASSNAVITDRGVYVVIDGAFTDVTEPHIFQKAYNAHSAVNIALSVFNFAAQKKPNDLFSNAFDLLQFSTTAGNPAGTYQFVGAGGFTVPGARNRQVEAISTGELSEALEMADQRSSPILDVNLGTTPNQQSTVDEPFSTTIYVDASLDELEVSAIYKGDENAAALTLYDPNGDPTNEVPDCDSDGVETSCTYLISAPLTGTWTFEVETADAPLELQVAATGYALNGSTYQALLISEVGPLVSYPEKVVLVAELSRGDRIADAGITAWVENPDGSFSALTFKDDGVAPDKLADDGQYTGLLLYTEAGDYLVTTVFDNIKGTARFTQVGMADATTATGQLVGDDFGRFASLEVLVQDYAADDHGDTDADATDLLTDNDDVAGRIDQAGDIDSFRITSPDPLTNDPKTTNQVMASATQTTTRYILRLTHFAFGMNALVRVTTKSGTQEYTTGALAYDAYWVLPLDLEPGEVVRVEVLQTNGQSASGQYDISFGKPLFGEPDTSQLGNQIYLPLVNR
ncbi:MAG: LamG-like jellyroll fold domain-containing protein [Caldilineaceae bacterium]